MDDLVLLDESAERLAAWRAEFRQRRDGGVVDGARAVRLAVGGNGLVPRISEFFGIVIYMYWFDQQKHKTPHLHARFAGEEAVFDLGGRCLEGDLGSRAARLVEEWCRERTVELQAAWAAAAAGKEVPWVAPLR